MRNSASSNARKHRLHQLAETQFGYFTARQAVDIGYTYNNHQYHLDKGNWLKIASGLFRLPGYADTLESAFARWSLWSRNQKDQPQGVVSHDSALAFFGFGEAATEEVHLTVPVRFQKTVPPGVAIHKGSVNLSDLEARTGFMITRPAKTLEDLRERLSAQNAWESTVEKAFAAGKLSWEERQQLGFAPNALALDSASSGGAFGESASPQNRENAAPEDREADRPESMALLKERIYMTIFRRTQTASQVSRRRAQAGFTLVELLVVTAIISVLAAMLLPVLEQSLHNARSVQCRANQKQLGVGMMMYADDNQGRWIPPRLPSPYWTYWSQLLQPYLGKGTDRILPLVCPEYVWADVISDTERKYYHGYILNQSIRYKSIDAMPHPSRTCATWDDMEIPPHSYSDGAFVYNTGHGSFYIFAFRHLKACNLLRVDGSVSSIFPRGLNQCHEYYPEVEWEGK